MENFNQIEKDILDRINKIKDRSTYEITKTEIFGKKAEISRIFKKLKETSKKTT